MFLRRRRHPDRTMGSPGESTRGVAVCFDEAVPDAICRRATDVLWRAAPDRVMVRTVDNDGAELFGVAAVVWMALDEPKSISELEHEITPLRDEPVDVRGAVDALAAEHLVETTTAPTPAGEHNR